MAKARTLVGLDVHATKIVAAVLDAETGRAAVLQAGRRGRARRPGCAPGCRGRCARPMRPGRPATGWRASSRAAAWSAWSRRRARSRARRAIASRPIAATPSCWCGCCWRASCTRSASRAPRRRRCATWSARARRSAVDLMRCRHRLSKLLLRHGIRFEDGRAWTRAPPRLAGRRSSSAGRPRRRRCSTRSARSTRSCTAATRSSARSSRCCPARRGQPQVARLRCLRGIDTLTAVGLCAEIGDFERFARAEQLMSYVGLVPSESTHRPAAPARARSPRPAPATPAGCWSRPPGTTAPRPRDRQGAQPTAKPASPPKRSRSPGAPNSACTAPGTGSKQRAKRRTIIAVAAARELAGFCWAITRIE